MKKILLLLFVAIQFATISYGQNVLDGIYVKEHNPTRQTIQLAYLREADVMWSKRVWEVINFLF